MCYYCDVRVQEYIRANGSSPYKDWFDSLDSEAAAKITVAKVRMERGLLSAIKWFEGLGEYKIDWGPGYRIYLAKDGEELIVLFGGGTKQRQAADIAEAKKLHLEYKERKAKLRAEEDKLKQARAQKSKSIRDASKKNRKR